MQEHLSNALQENILVLLAYSEEHGKVVSSLVDSNLFEGDYCVIAERCVAYWRQHGEPPKNHTSDLVADIIEDPDNKKAQTYRRILIMMLELSESINSAYVLQQLRTFTRMQRLKGAILKSAEQLNARQEMAISEIEDIWNELLRARELNFDPGTRLSEVDKLLNYLQTQYSEFETGVHELDVRRIVPYRGAVMLFLAPPGRGKSWALVHLGKMALLNRKKIVHISLEMSEEEVQQRYYQSLFSSPKREQDVTITTLKQDALERVSGFGTDVIVPDFAFDSPYLSDELESRITPMGTRLDNILIKRFPPRSLTAEGLRAYLDNIEVVEHFIPDLLILDYIGIMQTDAKNHRISLGRVFEEFRAICIERQVAGVTAHQVSKSGALANQVSSAHVAEDYSMIGTADQVITYSCTEAEFKLGLARLYVSKARTEEDRFGVLITQSYRLGQFVLASTMLESKYFECLDLITKGEKEDDAEEDEEK